MIIKAAFEEPTVGSLPVSPHAILGPNPGAMYFYFQFTDEETEAQRRIGIIPSHTAVGDGPGVEHKKLLLGTPGWLSL